MVVVVTHQWAQERRKTARLNRGNPTKWEISAYVPAPSVLMGDFATAKNWK